MHVSGAHGIAAWPPFKSREEDVWRPVELRKKKGQESMFVLFFTMTHGEDEYFMHRVLFAPTEKEARAKALKFVKGAFGGHTTRDDENIDLFRDEIGARTIELEAVAKMTTGDLVRALLID